MANRKKRAKRIAKRKRANVAGRAASRVRTERPTPVQAIETLQQRLAARLADRDDDYSKLLSRLLAHEHRGQHLITKSGLTEGDHSRLDELRPVANASYREELGARTGDLRAALGEGHPLYFVAVVQAMNMIVHFGEYYEPTHSGMESKVELVAGLLATQPVADQLDDPVDAARVQSVVSLVDEIMDTVYLYNLTREARDDQGTLGFVSAMNWMHLRGASYAHHGEELAIELYGQYDNWMLEHFGFTVRDTLAMSAAVTGLMETRMNALMERAGEFANGVMEHLGRMPPEQLPDQQRAQLETVEGRQQIEGAALMHVFEDGLSAAATFTSESLVTAGICEARVRSMLAAFSIPMGSLPPESYTGLFDESPLVERPYLTLDERYILAVPGMASRDAVALLEPRFLADMQSYPDARAKTLDRLALGHLDSVLPGSTSASNVFYEIGSGDRAEVDGVIVFDSVALVVEGKAGHLSVPAQRGDLRRLAAELTESVEQAWRQGARVRESLLGDAVDSVFTDEHGTEVWRIPAGSIDTVFIVNPTLHELGGHAPQLAALKALGLFPGGEYPWSVFINDLRVIAETADNAAIFLHYLVWRNRLDLGGRVAVHDEIDLWGSYLLNERFPPLADDDGRLMIGNSSTDFDSYYASVMGQAPPRQKPRKFIEEPIRSFVARMADERPAGWLEAAGVCLDLSTPEVAAVCGTAKRIARAAAKSQTVLRGNLGRVRMVGLPEGASVEESRRAAPDAEVIEELMPEQTAAVAVYCRSVGNRRAEISWADYLVPPRFGTSAMDEAVFNAPERSPFQG